MRRLVPCALVIQLLLVIPAAAQRTYLKFDKGMDLGFAKWILLVGILGGLSHLTYWYVSKQMKSRKTRGRSSSTKAQRSHAFEERATALGFRQGEARTVQRIALRLAPKAPLNLLNSANGREYLVGDLDKRIAKRQGEIRVLEKLKTRLTVLREQDVHERETPRIEANLAVWVMRRRSPVETELFDDEDSGDNGDGDEPILENLDSVAGRLLDISEGGAAIAVDLDLSRGDRIQFWSAENTWVLGETRAGVLNTELRGGENILHVYFVDPDLRELRPALAELRGREGNGDEDEDE
ncbi:MAG: hypothetical protein HN712_23735 [Gemmatimonadetes bacterium]|jgi:hypothetical protein|nr:hypothetical protein [Gemmatimonadota bacterium]MBT7863349.1 hypothetical protein [Gemmatimonadota bacterium]